MKDENGIIFNTNALFDESMKDTKLFCKHFKNFEDNFEERMEQMRLELINAGNVPQTQKNIQNKYNGIPTPKNKKLRSNSNSNVILFNNPNNINNVTNNSANTAFHILNASDNLIVNKEDNENHNENIHNNNINNLNNLNSSRKYSFQNYYKNDELTDNDKSDHNASRITYNSVISGGLNNMIMNKLNQQNNSNSNDVSHTGNSSNVNLNNYHYNTNHLQSNQPNHLNHNQNNHHNHLHNISNPLNNLNNSNPLQNRNQNYSVYYLKNNNQAWDTSENQLLKNNNNRDNTQLKTQFINLHMINSASEKFIDTSKVTAVFLSTKNDINTHENFEIKILKERYSDNENDIENHQNQNENSNSYQSDNPEFNDHYSREGDGNIYNHSNQIQKTEVDNDNNTDINVIRKDIKYFSKSGKEGFKGIALDTKSINATNYDHFSNNNKIQEEDEEDRNFETQSPVTENIREITSLLKYIDLERYLKNLVSNGFDDLSLLINQIKSGLNLNDETLTKIGIKIPGHRAKLLIKLEEGNNINLI